MAATTKLIVYNEALREIGSAFLADIVTANTRLSALDAAFNHAVEFMLSKKDWGFARRRATLTGVGDSSFPPYTYRYSKPSDYLRKCWVKVAADDEYQLDHAEVAAVIYGFATTALIEYVSDHADNYDPANWPPHFTRVLVLYLAALIGPKIARLGDENVSKLLKQMDDALVDADTQEAVFLTNASIPANRQPVFTRAIEFMGQALAGSVAIHSHTDKLRWQMNRAWAHSVKFCLESGAWNFATKRATLTDGGEAVPGGVVTGIIEGYSVGPATEPAATEDLPDMAGYDYGYTLPSDFLHKIWVKADATRDYEVDHQFMGSGIYSNSEPLVMEYIAYDTSTTDPALWPASFLELVAADLARRVAPEFMVNDAGTGRRLQAPNIGGKLEQMFADRLSNARTRDAIQQFPKQIPAGRFVSARRGSALRFYR